MKKLNNRGAALPGFILIVAVSVAVGEFGIHQGWWERKAKTVDTLESPAPIQANLGGEA